MCRLERRDSCQSEYRIAGPLPPPSPAALGGCSCPTAQPQDMVSWFSEAVMSNPPSHEASLGRDPLQV